MCKCSICKREFEYMDKWSPMLKNEVWKQVLNFYGLENIEIKREKVFNQRWDEWAKKSGVRSGKLWERLRDDDCHTYLCYECMEKALGRKLTRDDLIGENVPLNQKFEKQYFGV